MEETDWQQLVLMLQRMGLIVERIDRATGRLIVRVPPVKD